MKTPRKAWFPPAPLGGNPPKTPSFSRGEIGPDERPARVVLCAPASATANRSATRATGQTHKKNTLRLLTLNPPAFHSQA
jgi:hypothetical protein